MKIILYLVLSSLTILTSSYGQNHLVEEKIKDGFSNHGPLFEAQIKAAIERAGDNKAEILQALRKVSHDHKKGLEFLIVHMPEKDLKSLKADFLLENVALAYKARDTYLWAKQVPEEIFFNDVLPYASLNERRDNWRQDFYHRFSKYVKDAKTMEEAIKAINDAIQKEVNVKYSKKRKKPDQSPYESMEINMASCTGLSILLTDAFRSVGIPSRVAGIPSWTTMRGNHNWVEVWTLAKQWQTTEYNPSDKGLDQGWFIAHAAQSNPKSFYHSIYASSWKKTGQYFPLVWDIKNQSVPAVNVSARYIKLGGDDRKGVVNTCELRIDYTVGAIRVAIPVAVVQGDVEIKKGTSPLPTHDMNRFFTVAIKQGQFYQVVWQLPGENEWSRKDVKATADDTFLRIELGEK